MRLRSPVPRRSPPGEYKVRRQYAYFPKDPFHVAAREIDVWMYYKGTPGGDDATDMGALYAYTYLSCLYVIIQLNGQRHVAHVARDRRIVFARVALASSLSVWLSLSTVSTRERYTRTRDRGRSAAIAAWSNSR